MGPMDKRYGHTAFDLNHDGKISAAEWAFIDEVIFSEDEADDSSDDIDDILGYEDGDSDGDE